MKIVVLCCLLLAVAFAAPVEDVPENDAGIVAASEPRACTGRSCSDFCLRIYKRLGRCINNKICECLKKSYFDEVFANDEETDLQHSVPLEAVAKIEPAPRRCDVFVCAEECIKQGYRGGRCTPISNPKCVCIP